MFWDGDVTVGTRDSRNVIESLFWWHVQLILQKFGGLKKTESDRDVGLVENQESRWEEQRAVNHAPRATGHTFLAAEKFHNQRLAFRNGRT